MHGQPDRLANLATPQCTSILVSIKYTVYKYVCFNYILNTYMYNIYIYMYVCTYILCKWNLHTYSTLAPRVEGWGVAFGDAKTRMRSENSNTVGSMQGTWSRILPEVRVASTSRASPERKAAAFA